MGWSYEKGVVRGQHFTVTAARPDGQGSDGAAQRVLVMAGTTTPEHVVRWERQVGVDTQVGGEITLTALQGEEAEHGHRRGLLSRLQLTSKRLYSFYENCIASGDTIVAVGILTEEAGGGFGLRAIPCAAPLRLGWSCYWGVPLYPAYQYGLILTKHSVPAPSGSPTLGSGVELGPASVNVKVGDGDAPAGAGASSTARAQTSTDTLLDPSSRVEPRDALALDGTHEQLQPVPHVLTRLFRVSMALLFFAPWFAAVLGGIMWLQDRYGGKGAISAEGIGACIGFVLVAALSGGYFLFQVSVGYHKKETALLTSLPLFGRDQCRPGDAVRVYGVASGRTDRGPVLCSSLLQRPSLAHHSYVMTYTSDS